jgi:dihydroorotate dehydrogenase
MFYRILIRKLLFLFSPETVHYLVVLLLRIPFLSKVMGLLFQIKNIKLKRDLFGLGFPNPVGLAAGFDKNGEIFRQMGDLGFGFVEIGTVTPKGQPGNPKPRIFRLPKDEALINRMGFNNWGVEVVAEKLKHRPKNLIIGGNIGKNKDTPNPSAVQDYEICFNVLFDLVDFFVVNVSSPNTPHLRELQEKEPLTTILNHLQSINKKKNNRKPILLKIAPDLNDTQLDDIIDIIKESQIDGVIATNTTIERTTLKSSPELISQIGEGGLSGKPLRKRSTEVIRYLYDKSGGIFPIIGVGGVHSPEDAIEKLEAGASLVELYTGFIYEGPGLVKKINRAILKNSEGNRGIIC